VALDSARALEDTVPRDHRSPIAGGLNSYSTSDRPSAAAAATDGGISNTSDSNRYLSDSGRHGESKARPGVHHLAAHRSPSVSLAEGDRTHESGQSSGMAPQGGSCLRQSGNLGDWNPAASGGQSPTGALLQGLREGMAPDYMTALHEGFKLAPNHLDLMQYT
jgi:hypothetical protein